jgi:hypothetical protein
MRVPSQDAVPPADGQKKTTARIPLSEAVATAAAGAAPKTINIAPAARPNAATQGAAAPAAADPTDASDKRKTSRISLDAVLGSDGNTAGDGGPKTIRLKRPSEVATVKVGLSAPVHPPMKGDTAVITTPDAPRKGSQVLAAEASEEEGAASRKRTIRVKRAAEAVRVDVAGESAAAVAEGASAEDRPHAFFVFAAVATVLVGLVLAYVLTSQVCGRNISLTQLSYGAPGLDLPWWGRINGQ